MLPGAAASSKTQLYQAIAARLALEPGITAHDLVVHRERPRRRVLLPQRAPSPQVRRAAGFGRCTSEAESERGGACASERGSDRNR